MVAMNKITIELDSCIVQYTVPYDIADAVDTLLMRQNHVHEICEYKSDVKAKKEDKKA